MSSRAGALRRISAGDAVLVGGILALAGADLWRYSRVHGAPSGDVALIALRTRDVPADLPLVGAFSRYGWNHPGPWQFWLSRPFQVVLGDAGLYLAAWLVGVTTIGVTLWMLRRWAGTGTALAALVTFVAVVTAGDAPYLADPWNPTLGAFPVVLAVVAAWTTGEGWRCGPVIAVAAASFAVGLHVGAALPALLAVGLAAGWGVGQVRAGRFSGRWLVLAAAVGVVAWIPAVVDQVAGDGNLWRVARFAASGDAGERYGLGRGASAAVRLLGWSGEWRRADGQQVTLTGERVASLSFADVAVPVLLAVAAVGAAWRATRTERRLLAAAWLAWATTIVAFAATARPAFPYLAAWAAPVAALVWAATLGTWLERAQRALGGWTRPWSVVIPAVAGVLTLLAILPPDRLTSQWRTELDLAGMAAAIDDPGDDRPVLVCGRDPYLGAYVSALVNELDRSGVPVRTRQWPAHVVGESRVARPGEHVRAVTLVTGSAGLAGLEAGGGQPLARGDELDVTERARATQLVADLLAEVQRRPPGPETDLLRVAVQDGGAGLLRAAASAAPELAGELEELAALRPGVAAVVVPGCV